MLNQTTHGWHCHTVSGQRWLLLKAEYAHRCGSALAEQAAARERDRLAAQLLREREDAVEPFPGMH